MKAMNKSCNSCKWFRAVFNSPSLCMNPVNDTLFDWFNPSTGDTIIGVRKISTAMDEGYCYEYAINKAPGPHWTEVA